MQNQNNNVQEMTHRFYKDTDGIWYIDLPEFLEEGLGTKANLMMVAGADTFLEVLSNNKNEVTIQISTNPYPEQTFALNKTHMGMDKNLLDSVGHAPVDYGAYYIANPSGHVLWLCPVTEYVFGGKYPDSIYINVIESKPKTFYHLLVDESGSMYDCKEQTINGLFEQRNKIIELANKFPEQEIRVGLTFFNSQVNPIFEQLTVQQMLEQTIHNYFPNGNTALYDAIGIGINSIDKHVNNPDDTVVFIILTDGYENASRLFDLDQIRQLITSKEVSGKWTFSYLGATFDAIEMAEMMEIKRQNSIVFNKKSMGKDVWNRLSDSMDDYLIKKRSGDSLGDLYSKK